MFQNDIFLPAPHPLVAAEIHSPIRLLLTVKPIGSTPDETIGIKPSSRYFLLIDCPLSNMQISSSLIVGVSLRILLVDKSNKWETHVFVGVV